MMSPTTILSHSYKLQTGSLIEREAFQTRSMVVPDEKTYSKELKTNPRVVGVKSVISLRKLVGNSCAFQFIPNWKMSSPWGHFVQKNSSYRHMFSYMYAINKRHGIEL